MESKERTPSVIARLMGLDALPPQQPVHKQQRVLSENYLRRTASIGLREKRSSYECRSFRMNVEEQQEFKDVFEVPETPKMDMHCNRSVQKGKANLSSTEAKMAFIRQKFTDTERLSEDENLQDSKEFDDALEVLDSNKDLLLRYLQEPDSLFAKHCHDLQGVPAHSQSGHITVLKSSNAPSYRNIEICRKSDRTTKQGNVVKLLQKHENGLVRHSYGELGVDGSHKLLKSQLESKDETCLSPTRIVVLEPNFRKAHNAARSSFSLSSYEGSQPGYRKHKEFPRPKNGELSNKVRERKSSVNDMEPMRHSFRVSREIAREVTRQIKQSISSSFTDISRSGFRGDDASAYESEAMISSSPISFDWKNRYQTSFSYSNGSFVTREGKKRIAERWKMTKRFQEVGLAGRGSTLGEMLAMPDQETRPRHLNYELGKRGLSNRFGPNDGDANLDSPLGISSRDGWKDGCVRDLPRSRSLPASSMTVGMPKTRIRHEALHNDWCLGPEELVDQGKKQSRKQNFNQKDDSKPRNLRSHSKKSQSSPCLDTENKHTVYETRVILDGPKNKLEEKDLSELNFVVPKSSNSSVPCLGSENYPTVHETQAIPDELKNNLEERDLSEQNLVVPKSSITCVSSISRVADAVADGETEDVGMSCGTRKKQQSEPTACILLVKDGDSSSHVSDASIQQEISIETHKDGLVTSQCPGTDPESPLSLEKAYQPRLVSVLEPPFKEEISSGSECFESVSSDLRDLRMQLHPLQLESSEAYSEGSGMIVSSDEDSGEGSVGIYENGGLMEMFGAKESRDFSYVVDVLVESGFCGGNLEMGFETWNSPECPISPLLFETLEKKYVEQTAWGRPERRLLFDRINSGLMEILRPCMLMHTWAKPMIKRFSSMWSQKEIEEELWKLLLSHEKEASKDSSEKMLGREMRWLELGDDIDVIGREIERFLIDELAAEVASMDSF